MTREELEIMLEKNVDEYIKTRDVWYSIKAREIEEELERIKKENNIKILQIGKHNGKKHNI